ncbi:MAG: threonylcarbamoyl-AMP synthase [Gammaproteobacteria bacterium]|nr:threonylcarbamoyl-AMP synthase [Gammaproteobacteria bacterium]
MRKNIEDQYIEAAEVIRAGGVVCYPTEGVWGLGCDPLSKRAFEKLLSVKQRPAEKGVILLVSQQNHIVPFAEVPNDIKCHLDRVWPGFVTCLLPKVHSCPVYLTGKHNTIAIRMTAYKPLQRLCDAFGAGVVSTSANISGQQPVKSLDMARSVFGGSVDYYIDDELGGAASPSKIIDFSQQPPKVIRE